MARIRIITDITAYLSPDFIDRHQITVLPMEIRFGDEKYYITPESSWQHLFERMAEGPAQKMQALVSAEDLQKAYARLCREAEEILVILSSSELGQAYATAQATAQTFLGRCRITVMDSLSTSWGLGLVVQAAAQAAEAGQSIDEIIRLVRGMMPHIYLVFFVERLDYLERGGRIGMAQALLGTMLRIKPLLLMEGGDIIPLEKVRTQDRALEKLADFVAEFAAIHQVVILRSPLESNLDELLGDLQGLLREILPDHEFSIIDYDPLLACHLGPEALGVTVYEGM